MIEALTRGDLESAPVGEELRRLLEFVELLTRNSHRAMESDVARLREVGWSDEQIAESVYITALFAFFNRVADAFGLESPQNSDFQPASETDNPT